MYNKNVYSLAQSVSGHMKEERSCDARGALNGVKSCIWKYIPGKRTKMQTPLFPLITGFLLSEINLIDNLVTDKNKKNNPQVIPEKRASINRTYFQSLRNWNAFSTYFYICFFFFPHDISHHFRTRCGWSGPSFALDKE